MANFAERLAAARKAAGMTQEDLASKVHVARNTISSWEHGRTMPDLNTLMLLERELGIDFLKAEDAAAEELASATGKVDSAEIVQGSIQASSEIQSHSSISSRENIDVAGTGCRPEASAPSKAIPPHRMSGKKRIIGAAFLALMMVLGVVLFINREKPTAAVTMTALKTPVSLYADPDFEDTGYGWDFTFVITNENDIPFRPDKAILVFYHGDAIVTKMPMDYTFIRGAMDNDKQTSKDLPIHINWSAGYKPDFMDRVECVLQGTDDNGHEIERSAAVEFLQDLPKE